MSESESRERGIRLGWGDVQRRGREGVRWGWVGGVELSVGVLEGCLF